MPSPEMKSYEDLKNNESIQLDDNLKNLIKEIDEIKDTTNKDDDKIEWVFAETPEWQAAEKALNQNLLDSLNKLDAETIQILVSETDKLYNDINLQLSDDVKNSLKDLYQLLMQIVNEKNIENNVSELNANYQNDIERDMVWPTNAYQTIEWIWHIEWRNVIIEAEEKTDNEGKKYIDINGKPCYKYYDKMTWFWYSKAIYNGNIWCFYQWHFKEWKREWEWTIIYGNGYKYEWWWSNGKIHWKWVWTYPNGNTFTWTFEKGTIKESVKKWEEWVVTINSQEYKVVIKNNKMIITEPRNYRDKMIDPNKDDGWIAEAPQDFREIKWIWKFENGEFIFDSSIKQWKDNQGKYIELWWSRYHENNKNLTWTWYEYDFYDWNFYVWNFKNGKYENRWEFFWVDWTNYKWNFKDGKRHWKWTLIWSDWKKYDWNFKDGERHWKWTLTWSDWTKYEWNFEENEFVQWKIIAKIAWTEKTYDVVKYGKILKITSWSEEGKFLKWDSDSNKFYILDDARDNTPNKIDWIWHIEGNKMIFENIIEQTDDSGKKFVEVNWKKYNEYSDGMNWLWYRTWINYFYLWNFSDWNYNGEWTLTYSGWYKYEWNFKDGEYDWKWIETYIDWDIYDWKFEKGDRQWEWTMIYKKTWDIFTWQWKDNKMRKWKFTLKKDWTEKVYTVERVNDLMKITSWPDSVGKFINQNDWNTILDIPVWASSVEWLWYFKDGNFTFFSGKSPSSIRLEWKKYYKYNKTMSGKCYSVWKYDDGGWYLYIWRVNNGWREWQWRFYQSNWYKYEWNFKDMAENWEWIATWPNWETYDCRGIWNWFKGGVPYKWTYTNPNWKITNFKWTFDGRSPKRWTTTLKDNRKYTWAFKGWEITWRWKMTYDNWLVLDWNFNDWQLIKWTVAISWKKYNVEKDDKWLKITSPWENNGKYIVEVTWKIADWNVNINDDNLKDIFDVNDLEVWQANVIQGLREAWMDINVNNLADICKLRDPEKEWRLDSEDMDILKVDSKWFGEWYGYSPEELQAHYNYKRWRIIETIQSCVQGVIERNEPKIWKWRIRNEIRADLITLPREERLQILLWINEVIKKFNLVRKYLKDYPDPKELLCKIQWINDPDVINAIGGVTVKQHWINFVFFFSDSRSFQIAYDKSLVDSGVHAWWWSIPKCAIPELNWTLTLINWQDPESNTNNYEYWSVWHEWQHNRNCYFMPDKDQWPITYAKDEITAYLRDWTWAFEVEKWDKTIEMILTEPESHGWLYQYVSEWKAREEHKRQVRELLWYAKDLVELTKEPNPKLKREFVISVLADTPAKGRKDMHDKIIWAAKKGISIDSRDFWRAWTAEPEAAINEINLAKSIEEIQHILKDPKYSHIIRDKNWTAKWWIEVSATIDKYLAWKLDISYIPSEIRQQVQNIIDQANRLLSADNFLNS